jgi:hypothetical protein
VCFGVCGVGGGLLVCCSGPEKARGKWSEVIGLEYKFMCLDLKQLKRFDWHYYLANTVRLCVRDGFQGWRATLLELC